MRKRASPCSRQVRYNPQMVSGLVQQLLLRRGVIDEGEIERFLAPDFGRDTHHFSLLADIDRAVARILSAVEHGERIAVYADFDCDGVPGAALLHDAFEKIGYAQVEVYIPHRDNEGYGVHAEALTRLAERGVTLVITVDVGVSAVEPIRMAKTLGMDIIVTDHHEPPEVLPDAYAIINPKLGHYPFRDLCGSAVAWKLVSALLVEGRRRKLDNFLAIPEGWEKWLLDLVCIATIADLVPLVGENRVLAHFGLLVLRKTQRPGIRALALKQRLRMEEVSEDDIGFTFAPRLNAASRMGDPEIAFKLLTTKDGDEAEHHAAHLERLNTKRKSAVAAIVREARKRLEARFTADDTVVVLGDTAWKPSLLGLVANSLMNERGGVVCLWGANAAGDLKGSCRSDGSISVVELLREAKDGLLEHGGHHASGGFSISREQAHAFPQAIREAAARIESRPVARDHGHDALVGLQELSWALFSDVNRLAPFGMGNPKPVFRIKRASVAEMRPFGKDKNHVEVSISCFETGARARAFDFFRRVEDFTVLPLSGAEVDIVGTLVRDSFRGPRALAVRIVDILESRD